LAIAPSTQCQIFVEFKCRDPSSGDNEHG
jgi:hypothetical protein